jgi:hypothetical protein
MSENNPFFQARNYPGQGGGTRMFEAILGIVAVSALLSIAPAVAAEMECTEANMTKASADMDKMAAGERKTMGMKEMS